MIRFKCPSCGKTMGVAESKAGALGMCPSCQATFRIPETSTEEPVEPLALQASASEPEPRVMPQGRVAAPPAQASQVEEDDHKETYGVEAAAPPRRPALRDADDAADQDDPPSGPGLKRRDSESESDINFSGDLVPGVSNITLIFIVLGAGWVLFGGLTLLLPAMYVGMIGLGAVIAFVGEAWILLIAFDDGMATGVLSLVFWPYQLLFIGSNLDRTTVPLIIGVIGVAYMGSAYVFHSIGMSLWH